MNIKDIYKNIFADIQKKKFLLLFTVSLFFLAAVLNVVDFPEFRGILSAAADAIRRMAQEYHDKALLYIIAKIFAHNAIASFIALFSGALFLFIPISMVIANGYLIGFVVFPRLSDIGRLIPHCIFELPAFFVVCSYGIWLGLWPFNRGRINNLEFRLKQCVVIYFWIVVPLLFIAAIIEGTLFKHMPRH